MIASLLPGLRDVRTPLATGYLWLIALWLLLQEHVPRSVAEATGPTRSLYELGSILGSAAVLAAFSFIAYLLGSLLQVRVNPRAYVFEERQKSYTERTPASIEPTPIPAPDRAVVNFILGSNRGRSLYTQLSTLLKPLLRQATTALDDLDRESPWGVTHQSLRRRLESEIEFVRDIAADLGAVSIQLQAKNPDLWDTHDRHAAEAQFRLGISIPLVAIIIIFAIQSTLLWLFLLIVPLWLTILSYRLSVDAVSTLVQALVLEIVEPPVLERLREQIAKLNSELEMIRKEQEEERERQREHALEMSRRKEEEEQSSQATQRAEPDVTA